MAPFLHLWFFRLPMFKLVIALAFIVATLYLLKTNKQKKRFPQSSVLDVVLIFLFASFVGGKLFYSIFVNSSSAVLFNDSYMFFGSLIFAFCSLFVYSRYKKINFLELSEFLIPGLLIGIVIGAFACLLNGSCYGIPYVGPLALMFPDYIGVSTGTPTQVSLFPVQLLFIINGLVIFGVMRLVHFFRAKGIVPLIFNIKAAVLYSVLIAYAKLTFYMEFLRDDYRGRFYASLSISQWICVFITLTIVALWIYKICRPRVLEEKV